MAGREPPEKEPAGFLERWSARKRAARQGDEPIAEPAEREATPPEKPTPEEAERALIDSLPDLDSLGPGSDFKPFMQKGVPARLRTAALRKLWRSNPVLANLDGLNDYDTDYTDKATVVPDLRTAYQVGRGFLNRVAPADAPPPETEVANTGSPHEPDPVESPPDPAAPPKRER
jgi:hypothetical protein